MIAKFTDSLRVYSGLFFTGQVCLFITLYPVASLILFIILVPITYISIMLHMINEMHKQSGTASGDLLISSVYDAHGIPYYYMESPLDLDYDIGIH